MADSLTHTKNQLHHSYGELKQNLYATYVLNKQESSFFRWNTFKSNLV